MTQTCRASYTRPSISKLLRNTGPGLGEGVGIVTGANDCRMARAKALGWMPGRPRIDWNDCIIAYVRDCLLDGQQVKRIAKELSISKVRRYEQLHSNEVFAFCWSPRFSESLIASKLLKKYADRRSKIAEFVQARGYWRKDKRYIIVNRNNGRP